MSNIMLKSRPAQAPVAPWRNVLPIHPAAELLPRMSDTELRELGEDIGRRGLQSPIAILTDDEGTERLLDGINRLDAMELVGLPIIADGELNLDVVQTLNVAGNTDPFAFVLSANLHRRHLTREQKAELIEKVIKAKLHRSNRTIAKQVKADHKTVGAVREKLESTGEIPQLTKTRGADGKDRKRPARAPSAKTTVAKPPKPVAKAPEEPTQDGASR